LVIHNDLGGSFFGLSLSIEGDVNGDGYHDVAVLSPGAVAGFVAVYLGGAGTVSPAPVWKGSSGSGLGLDGVVALGADINGDGSSEVLVSNPRAKVDWGFPGAVFAYRLGPGYPVPQILHELPSTLVPNGDPVVLEATVSDTTHHVQRVEIHWRYNEDSDDQPVIPMQSQGDRYTGTIPAPSGFTTGFTYFIRAYDDYGLVGETELVGIEYSYGAGTGGHPLSTRVTSDPRGSATEIAFRTQRPGPAALRIFDVAGRLVATPLHETALGAGEHRIALFDRVLTASSGIFFYRLETVEGTRTGRLFLGSR
jgi:hypothetical protein